MANIQVVRIERRPTLGGLLLAHIEGRRRPAEARQREGVPAVIKLAGDVEAARRALKAAQAVKRRGPKPQPVIEALFAGPPPFEWSNAWTLERGIEWGEANLAWFKKRAKSKTVIAAAYLHLDEKSLHMHLLAVPIDEQGRLGWKRIEKQFTLDATASGSQIMRSLQDAYHAEVGEKFGLARGEIGSGRRHEAINRRKGIIERVLEAPAKWSDRQRADAASLDAADARRERDVAVERQREAEGQRDRAVEAQNSADSERAQAVEAQAQAVARAEAAESDRDQIALSRSERLRERDEARKARDAAHQTLERERAAREAETADSEATLLHVTEHLLAARLGRKTADQELRRLRDQTPPTQVAVDEARSQAQAADEARVQAEADRDKANAGWKKAYNAYVAEKQQREVVVTKRNQDVAAARKQGYGEGRTSRDDEVKAAGNRTDTLQVELDALRKQLPTAVDVARREGVAAGRAERDDRAATLHADVERLTTDLNVANQEREQFVAKVKKLTEHRDDLRQQVRELLPKVETPPPRPVVRREGQPQQDRSRSDR